VHELEMLCQPLLQNLHARRLATGRAVRLHHGEVRPCALLLGETPLVGAELEVTVGEDWLGVTRGRADSRRHHAEGEVQQETGCETSRGKAVHCGLRHGCYATASSGAVRPARPTALSLNGLVPNHLGGRDARAPGKASQEQPGKGAEPRAQELGLDAA
jgi:hypothetical protein